MNKVEFEARLNGVYDGAVKSLNRYLNKRATLCFHCSNCGLKFFGKPMYMVGKDSQRHSCNKPYGTANGERFSSVSAVNTKPTKKEKLDIDQLNQMVWDDYTYQQIAQELQVYPKIIKDYFKEEGLI